VYVCTFVQFMAFLIIIFLGEIAGAVLAIVFKDSVRCCSFLHAIKFADSLAP